MTVSTASLASTPVVGNDTWTVTTFNFTCFSGTELAVVQTEGDVDTTLVYDVDYTVTLNADQALSPGGSVTMAVAPTPEQSIQILSAVPYQQPTELPTGGRYNATVLERALDYLELQIKQLLRWVTSTLRVPPGEEISELPNATARRDLMMYFHETTGDLTLTPFTQTQVASAVAAAYDTGSTADAITFIHSGTGVVPRSMQDKAREWRSLKDYDAACDGSTDDYDAIMDAHDNAPEGCVILIPGPTRFTTPLVWTRRLDWVCLGSGAYLKPSVGPGDVAIRFNGSVNTGGLNWVLNVFSGAGSCLHGLVIERAFAAKMDLWVQVGALGDGVRINGPLESRFRLRSTPNFATPLGAALVPAVAHLRVDFDDTAAYAANASVFDLSIAGGVDGVVVEDQATQGNSTYTGTVQGCSGEHFRATGCFHITLRDLHVESSVGSPGGLVGCTNATLNNVLFALAAARGQFELDGCLATTVMAYTGGLWVKSNSDHTKIINARIDGQVVTDDSLTTDVYGGISSATGVASLLQAGGSYPSENFFLNPFIDVWTAGAAAAPDGFSAVAATFARSTAAPYGGNPNAVCAIVTSTALALANMCKITPSGVYASTVDARWVSFTLPVKVATGQPDLAVYVYNGHSYEPQETVTVKDSWHVVRGALLIDAGATPVIVCAPYDGGFIAGVFRVGGCSIVNGTTAPKSLLDSGARLAHVVGSVAEAPAFVGQRAYVSGTSKWYLAAGTAAAGDWKVLN